MCGPKIPFRNIEREFRETHDEPLLKPAKPFVKAWVCMRQEKEWDIVTKTIEDIQFELKDTELAFYISFIFEVEDIFYGL
jgi:hypothetical protein